MIEANETEIRTEMDGIYINKTKQIINTGRLREEYMTKDEKLNFQKELQEAMNQMKLEKKKVWSPIMMICFIVKVNLFIHHSNKVVTLYSIQIFVSNNHLLNTYYNNKLNQNGKDAS